MKDYAVVIGGLNIDIAGLSGAELRLRDSNPGSVRISIGGVGQNIARNLAMLGVQTSLISVCGDDSFGRLALADCEEAGIDCSQVTVIPGEASSTYLYINNANGDLVTAVNDMHITEHITGALLEPKLPFINGASMVVLDANLQEETIAWIAEHVTAPLAADTVSVAKAQRLRPVLSKLYILKPNELEAAVLAGITPAGGESDVSVEEAQAAARRLNDLGVRKVFVSMGAQGLLYSSEKEQGIEPSLADASQIVSTNGAGDCAMAAILKASLEQGADGLMQEAAALSQAAAAINMQAAEAFAKDLSWEAVLRRREKAAAHTKE